VQIPGRTPVCAMAGSVSLRMLTARQAVSNVVQAVRVPKVCGGVQIAGHCRFNIVLVWIEGSDPMMITPKGSTTNDYGETWLWQHAGENGSHLRDDVKGVAEAAAQFLMANFVSKKPPCQYDQ